MDAANKLNSLNAALTAAGGTAVTPANTLVITIPVGSESYEIVNAVEYPGVSLKPTKKTGTTTIGAVAVTRNGVVLNLSKTVNIYTSADDAVIYTEVGDVIYGGTNGDDFPDINAGETIDLMTYLVYDWTAQEEELGNITVTEHTLERLDGTIITYEEYTATVPETIKSYTWSSSDINVATISGKNSETCTINAQRAGQVMISLSVETVQGNVYTAQIILTITETPEDSTT